MKTATPVLLKVYMRYRHKMAWRTSMLKVLGGSSSGLKTSNTGGLLSSVNTLRASKREHMLARVSSCPSNPPEDGTITMAFSTCLCTDTSR